MDPHGHIYEIEPNEMKELLGAPREDAFAQAREDIARLDGYLRGRADSDRPKRGKGANKDLAG